MRRVVVTALEEVDLAQVVVRRAQRAVRLDRALERGLGLVQLAGVEVGQPLAVRGLRGLGVADRVGDDGALLGLFLERGGRGRATGQQRGGQRRSEARRARWGVGVWCMA